jgi:sRNA-binding regulator protein Hfq
MRIELRPNPWNNKALMDYVINGIAIDNAIRRHDRWHFNLADVASQVYFKFGITYRNPIYLVECERVCLMSRNIYLRYGYRINGVPQDFPVQMASRARQARKFLQRM